jgi:DNA replication protein
MKGVKHMKEQNHRLRNWIEQKNVSIPELFFRYYKRLGISDDEALLLLQLIAFHSDNIDFPPPSALADRMHFTENEITAKLQRLLQKGFIEITQGIDSSGKIYEKYSMFPLWDRIIDLMEAQSMKQEEFQKKNEEGELFSLFEQEFGRLLSPIEIETISLWLDQDHHPPKIIREALKEAVLAGKLSFRYIDRILFEWKKKNIRTIQQIEKQREQFAKHNSPSVPPNQSTTENRKKVPFYNWLDERE